MNGLRVMALFVLPIIGSGAGLVMLARFVRAHRAHISDTWAVIMAIGVVMSLTAICVGVVALRPYLKRSGAPRIRAVDLDGQRFGRGEGNETRSGIARKLDGDVRSFAANTACLAAQVLATRNRDVVVWKQDVADFMLECDDGTQVLIRGAAWLDIEGVQLGADSSDAGQDVRDRLGVPQWWTLDASVEARSLRAGTRVRVTGHISRETHPTLATGYRDGGEVEGLCGGPGAPVLICAEP